MNAAVEEGAQDIIIAGRRDLDKVDITEGAHARAEAEAEVEVEAEVEAKVEVAAIPVVIIAPAVILALRAGVTAEVGVILSFAPILTSMLVTHPVDIANLPNARTAPEEKAGHPSPRSVPLTTKLPTNPSHT